MLARPNNRTLPLVILTALSLAGILVSDMTGLAWRGLSRLRTTRRGDSEKALFPMIYPGNCEYADRGGARLVAGFA
ncbi:hypothetical protein [Asticcacaulis sp.]|uniref:hypothetical protein n=1 Tax=Asticcacaulis sp. TaxID=1872648 RepID=UPI0026206AB9|nr:hypothetical protein [Asticcacaulis sp.]